MNKKQKKIKIKRAETLETRYIHRKYKVGPFVQVVPKRQKEKRKKVAKR